MYLSVLYRFISRDVPEMCFNLRKGFGEGLTHREETSATKREGGALPLHFFPTPIDESKFSAFHFAAFYFFYKTF